jgi:hypothetical protein
MALWSQTNGTLLLAVDLCSLACVRLAAHDGRCAFRLLYVAAVRAFRSMAFSPSSRSRNISLV